MKIEKNTFEHLGIEFQVRLVSQLLNDKIFAESIIDILDPNYFASQSLKLIVVTIKDAYHNDGIIPDIGSLEFRLLSKITNEIDQKFTLEELKRVKESSLHDGLEIQKHAMLFSQQQELQKAVKKIQVIIDRGNVDSYEECAEILKVALSHGDKKDNGISVFHNIEKVLEDDFRDPIPTGIKGLDEIMNGGLAKKELAVLLAGYGVGKSTFATKVANTARDLGKNVLQIFFEDMPEVIQRKHIACYTGYELNDLSNHKEEILEMVKEKDSRPGYLILKKFPSDSTTIPIIKQYVKKLASEGRKPDLIVLDYIDCVVPHQQVDDVNAGEGQVMRAFETMLSEYDMAGWSFIQGNRSGISAAILDGTHMGGSIKKGQISHFLASVAKTPEQKENDTANVAIIKSRFGKDGIILENVVFNNATVQIDFSVNTFSDTKNQYKKASDISDIHRAAKALEASQNLKKMLENKKIDEVVEN